jgi:hypothetical protein
MMTKCLLRKPEMSLFKQSFKRCVWVLVLAGCVLAGLSCRNKNDDTGEYEATIASLRQQVKALQGQIDGLKADLANARTKAASSVSVEVSPQLAGPMLDDPNAGEDRPSEALEALLKNAVAQLIEQDADAGSNEENAEVTLLREENEQLRRELKRFQTIARISEGAGGEGSEAAGEVQSAEVLAAEWKTQKNPVHKINFLESLADLSLQRDPEILTIIQQALADPDPEVSLAASKMLKEYRSAEVLPVIEAALLSPNEEVRLNALEPLSEIDDPFVPDLMNTAFNDSSEQVRNQALTVVAQQEGDVQLNSLAAAMASAHEDVKREALSLLELRGDHQSVPVVMEGLKDQLPEYREEVNAALSFLIDQEFGSYDEAIQWWQANKDRYDDDLFEK